MTTFSMIELFYYLTGLMILASLLNTMITKSYRSAALTFGGGGGGGGMKGASQPQVVYTPAPAPTADSAATQAAVLASQQQAAAAAGYSSTDNTHNTLGQNPASLSLYKPTASNGSLGTSTNNQLPNILGS